MMTSAVWALGAWRQNPKVHLDSTLVSTKEKCCTWAPLLEKENLSHHPSVQWKTELTIPRDFARKWKQAHLLQQLWIIKGFWVFLKDPRLLVRVFRGGDLAETFQNVPGVAPEGPKTFSMIQPATTSRMSNHPSASQLGHPSAGKKAVSMALTWSWIP